MNLLIDPFFFFFFCFILLMPRQGDNAFFPAIICFRLKAWKCVEEHKKACLCSQAKMRAWRCITVPGGRRVQFTPSGFVTGLSEGEWNMVKFEEEPRCFFIVHFEHGIFIFFFWVLLSCATVLLKFSLPVYLLLSKLHKNCVLPCFLSSSPLPDLPFMLHTEHGGEYFSWIYIDAEFIRINIVTNVVQHVRIP